MIKKKKLLFKKLTPAEKLLQLFRSVNPDANQTKPTVNPNPTHK